MNKSAIIKLANHLEQNVSDKRFDYSSGSECILGHNARMTGVERYEEKMYWDAAIKVFGSKKAADLVFSAVEFKYKGDTRSFIKRLLGRAKGPEIELIAMRRQDLGRHYSGIDRLCAVKALRSLAEAGEFKFDKSL